MPPLPWCCPADPLLHFVFLPSVSTRHLHLHLHLHPPVIMAEKEVGAQPATSPPCISSNDTEITTASSSSVAEGIEANEGLREGVAEGARPRRCGRGVVSSCYASIQISSRRPSTPTPVPSTSAPSRPSSPSSPSPGTHPHLPLRPPPPRCRPSTTPTRSSPSTSTCARPTPKPTLMTWPMPHHGGRRR